MSFQCELNISDAALRLGSAVRSKGACEVSGVDGKLPAVMFFIAVWSPGSGLASPARISTHLGSLPVGFSTLQEAQKFVARSGSPPNCTPSSLAELLAMNPRAFDGHPKALLFTNDTLEQFFADPKNFPYERFVKELPMTKRL